eukprot:gnl/TRDRNA2_/TRDRNA2_153753_c0_seq5.p1 gnl/TRDRNA2_/TRDRNA2_153753_c0~~gnl/TRDRNA2_/TRDRNA2_153753_c0_seq5.p1  ORF type:complete len:503 (-),score=67.54 gnl/TRDRNA2_/TRDRNA2_153753_c0_seq5:115-1623(-)
MASCLRNAAHLPFRATAVLLLVNSCAKGTPETFFVGQTPSSQPQDSNVSGGTCSDVEMRGASKFGTRVGQMIEQGHDFSQELAWSRLMAHLRAWDGFAAPGISIRQEKADATFADAYLRVAEKRSVEATLRLAVGGAVFAVPRHFSFAHETCSPFVRSALKYASRTLRSAGLLQSEVSAAILSLSLLLEIRLHLGSQESSRFAAYFDMLPAWEDVVARHMLPDNVPLFGWRYEKDMQMMRAMRDVLSGLPGGPPGSVRAALARPVAEGEVEWAYHIVVSRAFQCNDTMRLMPGWDMLNHREGPDSLQKTDDCHELRAAETIPAGTEVFTSYTKMPCVSWISSHGFVPENADQCIEVGAHLVYDPGMPAQFPVLGRRYGCEQCKLCADGQPTPRFLACWRLQILATIYQGHKQMPVDLSAADLASPFADASLELSSLLALQKFAEDNANKLRQGLHGVRYHNMMVPSGYEHLEQPVQECARQQLSVFETAEKYCQQKINEVSR